MNNDQTLGDSDSEEEKKEEEEKKDEEVKEVEAVNQSYTSTDE